MGGKLAGTERYAESGAVGLHVMRRQWVRERITDRERLRQANGKQRPVREVTSRKIVSSYFKDGIDKEYRAKLRACLAEVGIGNGDLDDMPASYADLCLPTGERLWELPVVTTVDRVLAVVAPTVCAATPPVQNCRPVQQDPLRRAMAAPSSIAHTARADVSPCARSGSCAMAPSRQTAAQMTALAARPGAGSVQR